MSNSKEHVEKHIGESSPFPAKTTPRTDSSEQPKNSPLKHQETQKRKNEEK